MSKSLKITLVKSVVGFSQRQRNTVKALGLGKIDSKVVHDDNPQIRGMVNSIRHLLSVEEIDN